MRNKKTYIVLLVILVVFFVVMFLVFGLGNIRQSKYGTTLIVGDNTVWTYSNKKWLNLTTASSIGKLNWQEYILYVNNEKFGKYSLWHDDKWYAFDKDKNAVVIDGSLLAYRANFNMNILKFSEEEITDRKYVDYVLKENNLSLSSQFTSNYKTSVDLDNDGVDEEFYVISNVFPTDFDPEMLFSIVFMVKNDTVYYIYNDVSENRDFNGCKPYFTAFLDTNNDKMNEIILSCGRYSTEGTIDMLYKFEEDSFKIAISNQ